MSFDMIFQSIYEIIFIGLTLMLSGCTHMSMYEFLMRFQAIYQMFEVSLTLSTAPLVPAQMKRKE